MQALVALVCGIVFGAGLAISGMTNPAKVLAFLDVAGAWDPGLLFVMAGGVAVAFVGVRLAPTRAPLLAPRFVLPQLSRIDAPLVAGAAIFGVGWGIAGLCPGPGLTSLGTLAADPLVFVAAMIAGGLVHERISRQRAGLRRTSP